MSTDSVPARRLWLIDGFNVLHACLLSGRDRSDWWQPQRQREVMQWVHAFAEIEEVCVVFDAKSEPEASLLGEPTSAEVCHAPSADEAIIERVRHSLGQHDVHVVTADRPLGDRCRSLGARVERPWAFARRIASGTD